ncbi:NAD(P)-binding protein [Lojkania enalia]|uniref:NAD(P)-binding protein n=1 Tax=Lojkania enalia TaxID=147567 RepID=A0A9P4K2Y6_9PLEO|nr:NAD(P)-binding protein [Didymosphaeria enalia]
MTILVTGSVGKTSIRLASLLKSGNIPYIIATRRDSIPNHPATKFDWLDESTWANPFKDATISAAYLVPPDNVEPAPIVNKFIDYAISNGAHKFVFLGGSSTQKGGMYVGTVWSHLEEIGAQFAFLRPTWFMENFSESQHWRSIKEESQFYTAAEDGKIPFVSADDISEAAFCFLTGKKEFENRDYMILGPALLSHDEIAVILSNVLGRPIRHVRKSQEEMVEHYTKLGITPLFANFLSALETYARAGSEASFENSLEAIIGRRGVSFKEWASEQAKKGTWA